MATALGSSARRLSVSALLALAIVLIALIPSVAHADAYGPADQITGYVSDSATSDRIPYPTVYLYQGGEVVQTTSGDASGTYTFTGLSAGNYTVYAEAPGYHGWGYSLPLDGTTGWFQVIPMWLDVLKGTATCNGDPVYDAHVILYSRATSIAPWEMADETWTTEDGYYYFYNHEGAEFAVGFPGGRANDKLLKPYYHDGASTLASATPFSLSLTASRTIDLPLQWIDPSISGRVTNADGTPAAGQYISTYRLSPGGWQSYEGTTTNADGTYEFYIEPGVRRVGVGDLIDRSVLLGASFYTTSGPAASDVASASDITVVSSATASGIDIVRTGYKETLTGDAYEVDDLVSQAKPIATDGSLQPHTLLPAGEDDWMSFQVTAGHAYRIETTTSPVFPRWTQHTDTYLYLYDSDGKTKLAYNDDRYEFGTYNLRSLLVWTAPTTKTVYARVTDYSSAVGSESRRGSYAFRIADLGSAEETGGISGRITNSVTGAGVPRALIELDEDADYYSDADGYYRIDGLAAGTHDFRINASGYTQRYTSATIENAGDQVVANFTLSPTTPVLARIRGTVSGARGYVASATVTAVAAESTATTTTTTDSDGEYAFDALAPGSYNLTFSKPGYVTRTFSGVSVEASETTRRSAYLTQLGSVFGSITDSAGPLAGVAVKIDGVEATRTAADGTYSVGSLSLGMHTFKLWKLGYGAYTQELFFDDGDAVEISRLLSTGTVVPTKPVVTRVPNKSKLTYKRKHGRATFTLGVKVRDIEGDALGGVLVYLQRSVDGKHWTNAYVRMTDSAGSASHQLYATKKRTYYYRWVVRPTSTHLQVVTAKQRVTIR
jgi:5-hydroxyisourate hydrolase-like protein (transthyretin family)